MPKGKTIPQLEQEFEQAIGGFVYVTYRNTEVENRKVDGAHLTIYFPAHHVETIKARLVELINAVEKYYGQVSHTHVDKGISTGFPYGSERTRCVEFFFVNKSLFGEYRKKSLDK